MSSSSGRRRLSPPATCSWLRWWTDLRPLSLRVRRHLHPQLWLSTRHPPPNPMMRTLKSSSDRLSSASLFASATPPVAPPVSALVTSIRY
ncbi:hypothetical protein PHJA_001240800 [Phtheirospermum japonicum]|uniref:Uncharacterized protein n=1 Tax=Phtheirospermum japonicum TaxID=374723 RepID=A0A830C1F0_9LAMI|nr:hypothetical protein PHJA_001240800 [Phtheirospermum japonicum]